MITDVTTAGDPQPISEYMVQRKIDDENTLVITDVTTAGQPQGISEYMVQRKINDADTLVITDVTTAGIPQGTSEYMIQRKLGYLNGYKATGVITDVDSQTYAPTLDSERLIQLDLGNRDGYKATGVITKVDSSWAVTTDSERMIQLKLGSRDGFKATGVITDVDSAWALTTDSERLIQLDIGKRDGYKATGVITEIDSAWALTTDSERLIQLDIGKRDGYKATGVITEIDSTWALTGDSERMIQLEIGKMDTYKATGVITEIDSAWALSGNSERMVQLDLGKREGYKATGLVTKVDNSWWLTADSERLMQLDLGKRDGRKATGVITDINATWAVTADSQRLIQLDLDKRDGYKATGVMTEIDSAWALTVDSERLIQLDLGERDGYKATGMITEVNDTWAMTVDSERLIQLDLGKQEGYKATGVVTEINSAWSTTVDSERMIQLDLGQREGHKATGVITNINTSWGSTADSERLIQLDLDKIDNFDATGIITKVDNSWNEVTGTSERMIQLKMGDDPQGRGMTGIVTGVTTAWASTAASERLIQVALGEDAQGRDRTGIVTEIDALWQTTAKTERLIQVKLGKNQHDHDQTGIVTKIDQNWFSTASSEYLVQIALGEDPQLRERTGILTNVDHDTFAATDNSEYMLQVKLSDKQTLVGSNISKTWDETWPPQAVAGKSVEYILQTELDKDAQGRKRTFVVTNIDYIPTASGLLAAQLKSNSEGLVQVELGNGKTLLITDVNKLWDGVWRFVDDAWRPEPAQNKTLEYMLQQELTPDSKGRNRTFIVNKITYDETKTGEQAAIKNSNSEGMIQIKVGEQKTVVITNVDKDWDGQIAIQAAPNKTIEYMMQQELTKDAQQRERTFIVTNIEYYENEDDANAIVRTDSSEAFVQVKVTDQKTVIISNVNKGWDGVSPMTAAPNKSIEYMMQQTLETDVADREYTLVVTNITYIPGAVGEGAIDKSGSNVEALVQVKVTDQKMLIVTNVDKDWQGGGWPPQDAPFKTVEYMVQQELTKDIKGRERTLILTKANFDPTIKDGNLALTKSVDSEAMVQIKLDETTTIIMNNVNQSWGGDWPPIPATDKDIESIVQKSLPQDGQKRERTLIITDAIYKPDQTAISYGAKSQTFVQIKLDDKRTIIVSNVDPAWDLQGWPPKAMSGKEIEYMMQQELEKDTQKRDYTFVVTNITYEPSGDVNNAFDTTNDSKAFVQIKVTDKDTVIMSNIDPEWTGLSWPPATDGNMIEWTLQREIAPDPQGRKRLLIINKIQFAAQNPGLDSILLDPVRTEVSIQTLGTNGQPIFMDSYLLTSDILTNLPAQSLRRSRIYMDDNETAIYSIEFENDGVTAKSLSKFFYWPNGEDIKRIEQYAYSEGAVPDDYLSIAIPQEPGAHNSTIYYDAEGDLVQYSVSYDSEGAPVSISHFVYWPEDPLTTDVDEHKNMMRTDQYAYDSGVAIDVNNPPVLLANQMESRTLFAKDGKQVRYSIGYDVFGQAISLSVFEYWDEIAGTPERESEWAKRLIQYAFSGVPYENSDQVSSLPPDANRMSIVYFDDTGKGQVQYSLGFDGLGQPESLTHFNYWADKANTRVREDQYTKRLDQYAYSKTPPVDYKGFIAADLASGQKTSTVYFDENGENVVISLTHNSKGEPKSISHFYYYGTDLSGPRHEDKYTERIEQFKYDGSVPEDKNGVFVDGERESTAFFDAFGSKVLFNYGYKDNTLETLTVFDYQDTDVSGTPRKETDMLDSVHSYQVRGEPDLKIGDFPTLAGRTEQKVSERLQQVALGQPAIADRRSNSVFYDQNGQKIVYSEEYGRDGQLSMINVMSYQTEDAQTPRHEGQIVDEMNQYFASGMSGLGLAPASRTAANIQAGIASYDLENRILFDSTGELALVQFNYENGQIISGSVFHYQIEAGQETGKIDYMNQYDLRNSTVALSISAGDDRILPGYRSSLDSLESSIAPYKNNTTYYNADGDQAIFTYAYQNQILTSVSVMYYQQEKGSTADDESDYVDYIVQYDVSDYPGAVVPGTVSAGTRDGKPAEYEVAMDLYKSSTVYYDQYGEKVIYSYTWLPKDENGDGVRDAIKVDRLNLYDYQVNQSGTPEDESLYVKSLAQYKVLGDADVNIADAADRSYTAALQDIVNDELAAVIYFNTNDKKPQYSSPYTFKGKPGEQPIYQVAYEKRNGQIKPVMTTLFTYRADDPATTTIDESGMTDYIKQFTVDSTGQIDSYEVILAGTGNDMLSSKVLYNESGAYVLASIDYQNSQAVSMSIFNYNLADPDSPVIDFVETYDLKEAGSEPAMVSSVQRTSAWLTGLKTQYAAYKTGETYYDKLGEKVLFSVSYSKVDTNQDGVNEYHAPSSIAFYDYQSDNSSTDEDESLRVDKMRSYKAVITAGLQNLRDNPAYRTSSNMASVAQGLELESEVYFDETGTKQMFAFGYDDGKAVNETIFSYRTTDGSLEYMYQYAIKENANLKAGAFISTPSARITSALLAAMGDDVLTTKLFYDVKGEKVLYAYEYQEGMATPVAQSVYSYQAGTDKIEHISKYLVKGSPDPYNNVQDDPEVSRQFFNASGQLTFSVGIQPGYGVEPDRTVSVEVNHYIFDDTKKEMRLDHVRQYEVVGGIAEVSGLAISQRSITNVSTEADKEKLAGDTYFDDKGRRIQSVSYALNDLDQMRAVGVMTYQYKTDILSTDEDESLKLSSSRNYSANGPVDATANVDANGVITSATFAYHLSSRDFYDSKGERPIFSLSYNEAQIAVALNLFTYWANADDPATSWDEKTTVKSTKQYEIESGADVVVEGVNGGQKQAGNDKLVSENFYSRQGGRIDASYVYDNVGGQDVIVAMDTYLYIDRDFLGIYSNLDRVIRYHVDNANDRQFQSTPQGGSSVSNIKMMSKTVYDDGIDRVLYTLTYDYATCTTTDCAAKTLIVNRYTSNVDSSATPQLDESKKVEETKTYDVFGKTLGAPPVTRAAGTNTITIHPSDLTELSSTGSGPGTSGGIADFVQTDAATGTRTAFSIAYDPGKVSNVPLTLTVYEYKSDTVGNPDYKTIQKVKQYHIVGEVDTVQNLAGGGSHVKLAGDDYLINENIYETTGEFVEKSISYKLNGTAEDQETRYYYGADESVDFTLTYRIKTGGQRVLNALTNYTGLKTEEKVSGGPTMFADLPPEVVSVLNDNDIEGGNLPAVIHFNSDGRLVTFFSEYHYTLASDNRLILDYTSDERKDGVAISRTHYENIGGRDYITYVEIYNPSTQTVEAIRRYEYENGVVILETLEDKQGRIQTVTYYTGDRGNEKVDNVITYFADGTIQSISQNTYYTAGDAPAPAFVGAMKETVIDNYKGERQITTYELGTGSERIKEVLSQKQDASRNYIDLNKIVYAYENANPDAALTRTDMYNEQLDTPAIVRKEYFNGLKGEEKRAYALNIFGGEIVSDETFYYDSDEDKDGYYDDASMVTITTYERVRASQFSSLKETILRTWSDDESGIVAFSRIVYEGAAGGERQKYIYNYRLDLGYSFTGPSPELAETVDDMTIAFPGGPQPIAPQANKDEDEAILGGYIRTRADYIYRDKALYQVIVLRGNSSEKNKMTPSVQAVSQYEGVAGRERLVRETTYKVESTTQELDKTTLADINQDGVVDDYDVFLLQDSINQLVNRDLNGDGKRDYYDVHVIEDMINTLTLIAASDFSTGILKVANQIDFDGDGIIGSRDIDKMKAITGSFVDVNFDGKVDGNDIAAIWQVINFLKEFDTDGDGFSDFDEMQAGTDPYSAFSGLVDSDRDGVADYIEQRTGTNPYDASDSSFRLTLDSDSDGATNLYEKYSGTDPDDPVDKPENFQDSDLDGFSDRYEQNKKSNPYDILDTPQDMPDSDDDDYSDSYELTLGTNPQDSDDYKDSITTKHSDGDGESDSLELQRGTNPFDATDHLITLIDTDKDGLSNSFELANGSNPWDASDIVRSGGGPVVDSDGDGYSDSLERAVGEDPQAPGTVIDIVNLASPTVDSDADGILDTVERRLTGLILMMPTIKPVKRRILTGMGLVIWRNLYSERIRVMRMINRR
ncbi:MAG: hypothetical protein A3J12_00210 [Omnitrophica bacterium RIFCSPLOWO2_02_FULL_44_11]|nr:MAG: hypothetical protein A3J12_00210 [Omnitrophica bacterium RIFCSPLOWO2_02_FULL_44_11]